jgi:hypothetical protein
VAYDVKAKIKPIITKPYGFSAAVAIPHPFIV